MPPELGSLRPSSALAKANSRRTRTSCDTCTCKRLLVLHRVGTRTSGPLLRCAWLGAPTRNIRGCQSNMCASRVGETYCIHAYTCSYVT